ncbi:hypothetical protein QVD17_01000 [Tagetes erecta]|uniref:Uncharacterized protein n=1 Tax=Tagetes erecta TaxID=13708 RepID=A0AAD8L461_TARER|nr:hypothetical protein QVD17_01000 [Tagetes erecta]
MERKAVVRKAIRLEYIWIVHWNLKGSQVLKWLSNENVLFVHFQNMPLEKLAILMLVVVTSWSLAASRPATEDTKKTSKDEEDKMAKMLDLSKTASPPADTIAPSPGGPITCTAACMDICMVLEPVSDRVCKKGCEIGCKQVRGRGKIVGLQQVHKHNIAQHNHGI